MKQVNVLYFAALRDAAGVAQESLRTDVVDLRALYVQQKERYALPFTSEQLRVAVNGHFVRWTDEIVDSSEIAFIPPVSGG